MATRTTSVWGLNFMAQLDAGGLTKVTKQLAKLSDMKLGGFDTKSIQQFQRASENAAKKFRDTIGAARMYGLNAAADKLQAAMGEVDTKLTSLLKERANVEKAMAQARNESEKKALQTEKKAIQKEIQTLMDGVEKRAGAEMLATENIIKRREAAAKLTRKEVVKGYADGFEDAITGALSKMKAGDVEGIFKGMMKGVGKAGGAMKQRGAEGVAAGGGKAAANLAKMGAAIGVLAAAAGAFALIIKMMVDADGQAKEFNSTLMEGAGAADFAFSRNSAGLIDVTDQLGVARKAALSLAWEFRGNAKEILGVMAAANDLGLTFKEMDADASAASAGMSGYASLAQTAMVYSKNLGVSMKEIAEQTATWMHDLGGGLRDIDKQFATVFQAAIESGIGVKRFYGMITQATAGMFMYNVRVAEAAGLISELSDALGEAGAAEFVKGLAKGFAADSYTDRFKRIIIAGQGDVKEIMGNSAEATAKAMSGAFRSKKFGDTLTGTLKDMKVDLGINMDLLAKGDAGEMAKLGKLSAAELRRVTTTMTRVDKKGAMQLESVIKLARAAEGGIGDQARAMDELDMGGTLAMKLQTLGGPLSEMGAIELAGFEQYAGVSGESLKELIKVDGHVRGQYEEIQRLAALTKAGQTLTEDQSAYLKEQGVDISADGKTVTKNGKVLGSINDYLATQGDQFAMAVDVGMSEDRAIARGIASNTNSMANSIETGLQIVLEQIYDVMTQLLAWQKGMNAPEREAQAKALALIDGQTAIIEKGLERNADELSAAKELAMKAKAGPERVAAEDTVRLLEHERTLMEASLEEQQQTRKAVHRRTGDWGTGSVSAETMVSEAQGSTKDDRLDIIRRKFGDAAADAIIAAGDTAAEDAEARKRAEPAYRGRGGEMVKASDSQVRQAGFSAKDSAIAAGMAKFSLSIEDLAQKTEDDESAERISVAAQDADATVVDGQTDELTKAQKEDFDRLQKKLPKLTATEYVKALKAKEQEDIATLLSNLGLGKKEEITSTLSSGGNLSPEQTTALMKAGRSGQAGMYGDRTTAAMGSISGPIVPPAGSPDAVKAAETAAAAAEAAKPATPAPVVGATVPAEDFIYRGGASGGVITPINKADDLLGTKAGGAVDRMGLGGGGGGGVPVTINVYGNQSETMKAVQKGIRLARGQTPTGGKRG